MQVNRAPKPPESVDRPVYLSFTTIRTQIILVRSGLSKLAVVYCLPPHPNRLEVRGECQVANKMPAISCGFASLLRALGRSIGYEALRVEGQRGAGQCVWRGQYSNLFARTPY